LVSGIAGRPLITAIAPAVVAITPAVVAIAPTVVATTSAALGKSIMSTLSGQQQRHRRWHRQRYFDGSTEKSPPLCCIFVHEAFSKQVKQGQ
jgi:hypothetical protein